MSEAYRVMNYHHVTSSKRKRLLEEGLVPILDYFANVHLLQESIDDIMFHEDALRMKVEEFDAYEDRILTIQSMLKGDWLVEYVSRDQPIRIHKLDGYRHNTKVHLYVKHFAHVAHSFSIKPNALSETGYAILESAAHLETLPLSFSKSLDKYELLVKQREEKKSQDEIKRSIAEANRIKEERRNLRAVSSRKPGRPSRNGEVRIIKPAFKNVKDDIIQ